jgi:lambda family phage minor tail protein L
MSYSDFDATSHSLAPNSAWLSLFTLDLTSLGGAIINWTPGPLNGAAVSFAGIAYQPLPIEAQGFEYTGQGPLPTPTLKISNINNLPMSLVIAYQDCIGAIVSRFRTYQKYLDGQPSGGTGMCTGTDMFRVERKAHADKSYVQLELAAASDFQGLQLPGRVVLQNACTHTYRTWNGTTFVYGSCPYTGSAYFDINTDPVTEPSQDICGRRLNDCVARFGATTPLPTRAFPGVAINAF